MKDKDNLRNELIEELKPLISEIIINTQSRVYQKPKTNEKVLNCAVNYANELANIIRAYNGLLIQKELEEIKGLLLEYLEKV